MFSVSGENSVIFEKCCGYRTKSEKLINNKNTALGIASGIKMFTGLAVCKLIYDKKLTFDYKICDLLPYDLGKTDMYRKYPVYLWERLEYYLCERFGYSNAGFVLLGLVIETVSNASYQQFIKEYDNYTART